MNRHPSVRFRSVQCLAAAVAALLLAVPARGEDTSVATITVTSAASGTHLGGTLVEGVLRYRDQRVVLTLRGVAQPIDTQGTVRGLTKPRDIEGTYLPVGDALRNRSGVTIRFDPPLQLVGKALDIEATVAVQPKNPRGQPGAGVE